MTDDELKGEAITQLVTAFRERIEKCEQSLLNVADFIEVAGKEHTRLEQRVAELERLFARPGFEAGMVEGLHQRAQALDARLHNIEQVVEGVRVRIDRQTGSVSAALESVENMRKRFEDWKALGNELGEMVEAHHQHWGRQLQWNEHMTELVTAMRAILDDIRKIIINEGGGNERSTEGSSGGGPGEDGGPAAGRDDEPRGTTQH